MQLISWPLKKGKSFPNPAVPVLRVFRSRTIDLMTKIALERCITTIQYQIPICNTNEPVKCRWNTQHP